MSAKTSAEVIIDGKVYTLSGYDAEENWIHRYGIRWWQRKSTGRPFMP